MSLFYLKKIIFPYLEKKRKDLKVEKKAKALLIFDVFKDQTTSAVKEFLPQNDIVVIHVHNNHTNLFQPPDVSVNKRSKCYLSSKYQDWYAEKVFKYNKASSHEMGRRYVQVYERIKRSHYLRFQECTI